jgi:hypothetical protein
VTVLQFYPKHGVRQGLDDRTLHLDVIFFGHKIGYQSVATGAALYPKVPRGESRILCTEAGECQADALPAQTGQAAPAVQRKIQAS